MENNQIVSFRDNSIYLNSGLSLESFGKTNMSAYLDEKGTRAIFSDELITFRDFKFSDTASENDSAVFFSASQEPSSDIFQGTLSQILCEENSPERTEKIIMVLKAIDEALRTDFPLKASGGGGILVFRNSVIFLPQELFERSEFYNSQTDLNGKYIYKGLSETDSLIFLKSVIIYKALTGLFPYNESDLTLRQNDISDERFIPVEFQLKNISKKISSQINAGLSLKYESKNSSGRKDFSTSGSRSKNAENRKIALSMNLQEIAALLNSDEPQEDSELTSLRNEYKTKMERRISVKRFLRRNKNRILAGLAVIFGLWWMSSGFIKENKKLATTQGLSSKETTAVFYTMIHTADVPNLQEIIKGKETKDILFKIAGFYVTSKQREEQNVKDKSIPPEQWLFYKKTSTCWMYGITNLQIDDVSYPAKTEFPRRGNMKRPLSEENGRILHKGDEAVHHAQYYLIHQDPNRINVEQISEDVKLKWTGKRWRVISVEGKVKQLPVKTKTFAEDYFSLLEKNNSIKTSVQELKEKYPWLPADNDMKSAALMLAEEYGSTEAEKYLKEK